MSDLSEIQIFNSLCLFLFQKCACTFSSEIFRTKPETHELFILCHPSETLFT